MEANILVSRQCVFIKIFMTITDWSKNNGQCVVNFGDYWYLKRVVH